MARGPGFGRPYMKKGRKAGWRINFYSQNGKFVEVHRLVLETQFRR